MTLARYLAESNVENSILTRQKIASRFLNFFLRALALLLLATRAPQQVAQEPQVTTRQEQMQSRR